MFARRTMAVARDDSTRGLFQTDQTAAAATARPTTASGVGARPVQLELGAATAAASSAMKRGYGSKPRSGNATRWGSSVVRAPRKAWGKVRGKNHGHSRVLPQPSRHTRLAVC